MSVDSKTRFHEARLCIGRAQKGVGGVAPPDPAGSLCRRQFITFTRDVHFGAGNAGKKRGISEKGGRVKKKRPVFKYPDPTAAGHNLLEKETLEPRQGRVIDPLQG